MRQGGVVGERAVATSKESRLCIPLPAQSMAQRGLQAVLKEEVQHVLIAINVCAQSMAQRGLQAVLKEEVQHALELLRKATAPEPSCEKGGKGEEQRHHHLRHRLIRHHPHPASRISQQDLAACKVGPGLPQHAAPHSSRSARGNLRRRPAGSGGLGAEVPASFAGQLCRLQHSSTSSAARTQAPTCSSMLSRDAQGLVFGRAHKAGRGVASVAHGTGFAMARHVNEAGELFWSAPAFLHVVGHGVGIAVGEWQL